MTRRLCLVLFIACLLGASALVVSGLVGLQRLHLPLIMRDLVGIQGVYLLGGDLLSNLFSVHVDHILAFQRLLAWIDVRWLGAQQWAALAAIPLSCAALGLLVACGAARDQPAPRWPVALLAGLLAAGGLLWVAGSFNLFWAMQAHFFMAPVFGLAAATLLARRPDSMPVLLAALLLLAMAGVTSGSGLVSIVALALVLLPLRLPRRRLALIYGALALLLVSLFLLRAETHRRDLHEAWDWWRDPLPVLQYLYNYLQSPAMRALRPVLPAYQTGLWAGIVTGLGFFGLLASAWWGLVRRRPSLLATQGQLLCLIGLGSGLVTALVRLDGGIQQAFAERYFSTALLYWIGLLLLLLDLARRGTWRRQAAGLLALALLQVTLVVGLPRYWRMAEAHHAEQLQAAAALLGATDPDSEAVLRLHPNLELADRVYGALRDRQGGVFAWPEAGWIGQPLGSLFQPSAKPCAFATRWLPTRQTADGNLALVGWTADQAGAAPDAILLVDAAGNIAALTWPSRGTQAAQRPRDAIAAGWELWLTPAQRQGGQLLALTGATYCPLAWP